MHLAQRLRSLDVVILQLVSLQTKPQIIAEMWL
jgi:hypothetical protein